MYQTLEEDPWGPQEEEQGQRQQQAELEQPPGPEIRQFTIWYAGSLERWAKRIGDQVSDVPIIYFS